MSVFAVTQTVALHSFIRRFSPCFALIAIAAASPADGRSVRILLTGFSCDRPIVISGSGLQYRGSDGSWVDARERNLALPPGGDTAGAFKSIASRAEFRSKDGALTVKQGTAVRSYRGVLMLTGAKTGTCLLNVVDIEEYLRGVVPCEMPASFPAEALKAQAVAARSFTIANAGKHAAAGADLCDSDHCQVYGGAGREHPETDAAVAATAGEVLVAQGRVLAAQYSSNCGGHTSPSGALGAAAAVPDRGDGPIPYCAADSGRSWQCRATQEQVLAAAGERRPTPLRRLKVSERDVSGRVRKLILTHDYGTSELSANALRSALGLSRMKSLLCSFSADPATGDILISGTGWGHGAGLCQWGARGMALPPHTADFRQILGHYYRGATLSQMASEKGKAAAGSAKKTPPSP